MATFGINPRNTKTWRLSNEHSAEASKTNDSATAANCLLVLKRFCAFCVACLVSRGVYVFYKSSFDVGDTFLLCMALVLCIVTIFWNRDVVSSWKHVFVVMIGVALIFAIFWHLMHDLMHELILLEPLWCLCTYLWKGKYLAVSMLSMTLFASYPTKLKDWVYPCLVVTLTWIVIPCFFILTGILGWYRIFTELFPNSEFYLVSTLALTGVTLQFTIFWRCTLFPLWTSETVEEQQFHTNIDEMVVAYTGVMGMYKGCTTASNECLKVAKSATGLAQALAETTKQAATIAAGGVTAVFAALKAGFTSMIAKSFPAAALWVDWSLAFGGLSLLVVGGGYFFYNYGNQTKKLVGTASSVAVGTYVGCQYFAMKVLCVIIGLTLIVIFKKVMHLCWFLATAERLTTTKKYTDQNLAAKKKEIMGETDDFSPSTYFVTLIVCILVLAIAFLTCPSLLNSSDAPVPLTQGQLEKELNTLKKKNGKLVSNNTELARQVGQLMKSGKDTNNTLKTLQDEVNATASSMVQLDNAKETKIKEQEQKLHNCQQSATELNTANVGMQIVNNVAGMIISDKLRDNKVLLSPTEIDPRIIVMVNRYVTENQKDGSLASQMSNIHDDIRALYMTLQGDYDGSNPCKLDGRYVCTAWEDLATNLLKKGELLKLNLENSTAKKISTVLLSNKRKQLRKLGGGSSDGHVAASASIKMLDHISYQQNMQGIILSNAEADLTKSLPEHCNQIKMELSRTIELYKHYVFYSQFRPIYSFHRFTNSQVDLDGLRDLKMKLTQICDSKVMLIDDFIASDELRVPIPFQSVPQEHRDMMIHHFRGSYQNILDKFTDVLHKEEAQALERAITGSDTAIKELYSRTIKIFNQHEDNKASQLIDEL